MLKIICTVGLPCSSKSTWAKEFIKKEPGKWKRVNKDLIREMLDDSIWSPENEEFVNNVQENIIRASLRKNINIVNDNTNLSPRIFKRMIELAQEAGGDIQVFEKIFDLDVDECVKRDALRHGKACVGEKVIRDMYKKYDLKYGYPKPKSEYVPKKEYCNNTMVIDQDDKLKPCIICDIDGSISQPTGRNVFDTAKCLSDTPVKFVIDYIEMAHSKEIKIIFLTGRSEKYRDLTNEWLDTYLSFDDYDLIMRPDNDQKQDALYKEEVYLSKIKGQYYIASILEDRPRIVRLLREKYNLPVFQLNHKEF